MLQCLLKNNKIVRASDQLLSYHIFFGMIQQYIKQYESLQELCWRENKEARCQSRGGHKTITMTSKSVQIIVAISLQ